MRRRWTIWLHPTVQPTVYQRNRSRMGVCVNAPLINISPSNPPTPPPPTTTTLTPPQRGLSDGDGERMSLSGWLSAAGPGPGHIPALWAQVGGLPLSVGLKGLAWRRAAAQQQDVPLRLSFWYKNTNLARLRQRLLTEQATESIGWGVSNANVFFFFNSNSIPCVGFYTFSPCERALSELAPRLYKSLSFSLTQNLK